MAAKIDRLGETRMMNCGMETTIIRYGSATDIDVRFEDGTVAEHKKYDIFRKGEIAHESLSEPLHLNQKIQVELLVIITCEIRVYRGFRKLPNRRSADCRRNPLYT